VLVPVTVVELVEALVILPVASVTGLNTSVRESAAALSVRAVAKLASFAFAKTIPEAIYDV
jgi:hypothetical protein